jgi:hypothetical protein
MNKIKLMDNLGKIKHYIKEIVKANSNLPIPATVLSVQDDHITVKLSSGLKLSDVKLKATINNNANYILITPKVNSQVLLLSLSGGMDNLTVIKIDEIEKVRFIQGDLEVLIDGSDKKVSIKNSDCSLVDALTDLVTALKALKVFTPVGPSGIPLPNSILAFEAFETKFKTLLK